MSINYLTFWGLLDYVKNNIPINQLEEIAKWFSFSCTKCNNIKNVSDLIVLEEPDQIEIQKNALKISAALTIVCRDCSENKTLKLPEKIIEPAKSENIKDSIKDEDKEERRQKYLDAKARINALPKENINEHATANIASLSQLDIPPHLRKPGRKPKADRVNKIESKNNSDEFEVEESMPQEFLSLIK